MAHVVSICLTNPDDLVPVARAAERLIGDPFLFALVEGSPDDRSEPDEVHLMLRIDDAEEPGSRARGSAGDLQAKPRRGESPAGPERQGERCLLAGRAVAAPAE